MILILILSIIIFTLGFIWYLKSATITNKNICVVVMGMGLTLAVLITTSMIMFNDINGYLFEYHKIEFTKQGEITSGKEGDMFSNEMARYTKILKN